MEIKTDEAMSLHTTFRTGGPAKYFITVNDADELKKALSDAERPFIIGNGSNLLADDRGFDGTVIRLQGTFTEIKTEGNKISAGSGALLSTAAQAAAEASLTGMEFSYGIPGTVGGAVFMNAGAFGGEMRDVVEKVTLFDRETGEITDIPGEDMGFGYRKSILKGPDPLEFRYVILGVLICLKEGDKDEIIKKMTEIKDRRVQKQPLTYPSAGSVFKRPEGYFAGKLIEDAGMKGAFVGGAQVSEMHAGFIINRDNATSGDVKALIRQVQDKVYSQSGVRLEREIIYL